MNKGISLTLFGALVALVMPLSAHAALGCAPARTSTSVGGDVALAATGGFTAYNWVTENETHLNIGPTFVVDFDKPGTHVVYVTSQHETAFCVVDVFGSVGSSGNTSGNTGTPGLPNTGGGGSLFVTFATAFLVLGFIALSVTWGRKTLRSITQS
ncbi:hypothetical protein COU17_01345 [Candidatus Kaiserbacteria bacterium CG10_big_fil_rev_8_21_14_0_10_49_17]|uniref:Gram-positive cocci surface proteins LPxTG domain-containing protein n=1 Tax=Candidatus Kaiserbacteria bacterium CG10_big_fil_rev_8_21_14_0_10_49_17 TaxID=1974609 RepID=A0A2M6WET2_9BACT|nr:MAG: hypothetical protein COU17_01345 [Candidatus Kaiserbacteria bacterium CG10_big_fil_rev_8_21_14_0_10_49_17]